MKTTLVIVIIAFLFYTSCRTRYIVNDQGGVRPRNEKMFRYDNKHFVLKDNSLIDTSAIYLRSGATISYGSDTIKLPTAYYRFWSNGRVQEVYPGSYDYNACVNNTEIGYIGYYYIKRGRLKMQMIETLNGGQTGLRFGLFDNGDIWFYEQRPETYFGSWNMLKLLESKNKTKWERTSVDSLNYVQPTW